MMLKPMVALGVLAMLTGCANRALHYDFDARAGFAGYKTFAWHPGSRSQSASPIMDGRIRRIVEQQLTGKGFREEPGGETDFLVTAYTLYTPNHSHTSVHFGLVGGLVGVGTSLGGGHRGMSGTIFLEVQDYKTLQVVWKGSKEDVLDDQESPEDAEEDVTKAVGEILAHFPPTVKTAI